MGIPLQHVLDNIERFLKLKREGNYKMRVRIVMLDTVDVHPHLPTIRRYWKERGVKININQLENRGNHKNIQSDEIAVHELQTFDWCDRLFDQMYVLYDGQLVQCCADWEQLGVMGDLSKTSVTDAWHGTVYTNFRRKFLEGDVGGTICDGCTKDAVGPDDDEF